jgi:phenylalanyl-tRNA synthetase beta chain
MKYSLSWLREFVDVQLPMPELKARLLSLGFELAGWQELGPAFEGVVTAEVLETRPHPNADRLRLCDVSDGKTQYKVVCGAPNVAKGQKVPFAKIGARLPGGLTLKPAKIRGEESQGMICSGKELGLTAESNGIHVLPADTPLGVDFASTLGDKDTAFEVEITPNRPDLLSHLGLARELAWSLQLPLKPLPQAHVPEDKSVHSLAIDVQDAKGCPRYVGRGFSGVKLGPSPAWLAKRLETCGLRPINSLVDITNYFLLSLGQPMHAFDAKAIEGGKLIVRRASAGEKFAALDGKEYVLSAEDLVIADAKGPVALAGVIGGTRGSVTDATTDAFLECAYFDPDTVRKTARRLGVRTDSSYRFERGIDYGFTPKASDYASEQIVKLCGAKASAVKDVYDEKAPVRVSCSLERVRALTGMALEGSDVERVLRGLDASVRSENGRWTVTSPTWRVDLAIEEDLAEEVARLVGYDKIPTSPAPASMPLVEEPAVEEWTRALRGRLVGLGLFEAMNYDFLSEAEMKRTGLPLDGVKLANPISADWVYLRPSLLPALLRSVRYNVYRGAEGVRLFELGRTFQPGRETACLAGVLSGPEPSNWARPPAKPDFAALKGVVESLLDGLVELMPTDKDGGPLLHPKRSLSLASRGKTIGRLGQVHPSILKAWELDDAWYFELELDKLPGRPPWSRKFQPFSAYPAVTRDLSIVLPDDVAWSKIEQTVRKAAGDDLAGVTLFDVFRGGKIPAGSRSLTLRLTLVSPAKTLSDAEIQSAVQRCLDALTRLGAVLRS